MSDASLGRAILTLATDSKQFTKGVDAAKDRALALQASFIKVGGALAPLSAGLVAVGVAATKLASDSAETSSKFETVFGDAEEAMSRFIKNLRSTVPATTAELKGMTAELQDLLVPLGVAPDKAVEMNQQFTQLAADLASFNNVPLVDALGAIKSGLVGSSEPLRKFGIDVRQSAVEAKALELGLIDADTQLSKLAPAVQGPIQAQAVLAIALQQSSFALGDAARTSESTANQFKFLESSIGELTTRIGEVLLPFVTQMIAKINEAVTWLQTWDQDTLAVGVAIAAVVAAVGPLLIAIGLMIPAITAVVGVLSGPVGIVIAIGAAVTALMGFTASNETVRTTIAEIWDAIKEKFEKVFEAIGKVFDKVSKHYSDLWDKWGDEITAIFEGIWKVLQATMKAAWDIIGGILSGAVDVLTGTIEVFAGLLTGDWELLAEGLKTIWSGLWEAIKTIIQAPLTVVDGLIDGFTTTIKLLWESWSAGIEQTWTDLWNAVKSIITAPIEAVKGAVSGFTGSVTGFFQGMYDTLVGHSIVPDLMSEIGVEFDRLNLEVVPDVEAATTSIAGKFSTMASDVTNTETGLPSIGGAFEGLLGNLKGKIIPDFGGLLDGLTGKFKGLWSSDILGGFGKLGEKFSGLLGTVTDVAGKIGSAVTNIASGIANIFSGGLTGFIGGFAGGLVGGLVGGGGGKDKAIEENTRYCRIALVGPNGVIDILHDIQTSILWKIREAIQVADGHITQPLWKLVTICGNIERKLGEAAQTSAGVSSVGGTQFSIAGAGAGGSTVNNFTIQALDNSDMERTVRKRIIPLIDRYNQNNRGNR